MLLDHSHSERVSCYCALCISRCGAVAVIEDERFVALEPDPTHPTGQAICAKGRAAPELVYHPDRLLYPLKRTEPKGAPDPGWQRISWEEALTTTAKALRRLAEEHGPESVVFSVASPSTSASTDFMDWLARLMRVYGSPNLCSSMELCGWGRYGATTYTFGASVPGAYVPDLDHAGCILFWGYNPNLARLAHATATVAAQKRGARLIVVDPRRVGIANRADLWLQVRPGTDGALALGIAHLMIERGWYDEEFVRTWTNAPLLVRTDTGRLLREADLASHGSAQRYVVWDEASEAAAIYDPARGYSDRSPADLALFGTFALDGVEGTIVCRPVFDLTAELCRRYPPSQVEAICGLDGDAVELAAQLLWEARPVAYYAWSGVEQQTNATQIARAIAQLYALTGSFDAPGGNVALPAVPAPAVAAPEAPHRRAPAAALGLADRPLGPGRWGHVSSEEVYRGILEQQPYAVRGLVGFGANLLLSHSDSRRGRQALAELDFYAHADLFMNPTAELADIVLPVSSCFEHEALKLGFEINVEAQSLVQLRAQVATPPGEARSDMELIFDLARRLGYGSYFFEGEIDAAYRHQLGASGLTLEELRQHPAGVRVPLTPHYRKFAALEEGVPRGFNTPTRKIELYAETLLDHGYAPLPDYEEPLVSPRSQPALAEAYPLILTCAKHTLFCESQHRALPSLRRRAREPEVELHPDAAAARKIEPGDWVRIETPNGAVRARARLNATLQPDVVCGQHGWWQACTELNEPGYDPFTEAGANLNLIVDSEAVDPVSGSVPHRAYLCEIRRVEEASAA